MDKAIYCCWDQVCARCNKLAGRHFHPKQDGVLQTHLLKCSSDGDLYIPSTKHIQQFTRISSAGAYFCPDKCPQCGTWH